MCLFMVKCVGRGCQNAPYVSEMLGNLSVFVRLDGHTTNSHVRLERHENVMPRLAQQVQGKVRVKIY